MCTPAPAPSTPAASATEEAALATVELRAGLALAEVHAHLQTGMALRASGNRVLAFYLCDMDARRLHQSSGHSSTAHYAEAHLGLEQRRARELIAVGRKLLELTEIDAAFCAGELGWSKLLALVRVAVPEHEQAWLERAQGLTVRQLQLEVRLARPGAAPRRPGETKGLPNIVFPINAQVPPLTHQKLQLALAKLSAERGQPASYADLLDVMSELFLNLEEDGRVPGRTRVSASLYRVVLHASDVAADSAAAPLVADTDYGPLPIPNRALIECDAEAVNADGTLPRDRKTPPGLRQRVIARDGGRCRCCASRDRLMVHHIRYLSAGGRTRASNLITLCTGCHSLVHADLLVLQGNDAAGVRFVGADGDVVNPASLQRPDAAVRVVRSEASTVDRPTAIALPPSTRPPFDGLVGREKTVDLLRNVAKGRQARELPFPHALFIGPPGTGKTTLARGIAALAGSPLVVVDGPALQTPEALAAVASGLRAGDTLFIDEIHATPRRVLETLYPLMAENRLLDRPMPPITVVAATTEGGSLPEALKSRFGLVEVLALLDDEALATLVQQHGARLDLQVGSGAANRIARCARGTPREAIRMVERVADTAAVEGTALVHTHLADQVLRALGYDEVGLHDVDRRYLDLLQRSADPLPLSRVSRLLGVGRAALQRYHEPHLIQRGLLRVTPRGRVAAHPPRLLGSAAANVRRERDALYRDHAPHHGGRREWRRW